MRCHFSKLSIEESLQITGAVGRALEAAHRRGIVHRDIKPENVFLSGDHVYVVDFGVAKAVAETEVERLTSTGLSIGDGIAAAREQAGRGAYLEALQRTRAGAFVLEEVQKGAPVIGTYPPSPAVKARSFACGVTSAVRMTMGRNSPAGIASCCMTATPSRCGIIRSSRIRSG